MWNTQKKIFFGVHYSLYYLFPIFLIFVYVLKPGEYKVALGIAFVAIILTLYYEWKKFSEYKNDLLNLVAPVCVEFIFVILSSRKVSILDSLIIGATLTFIGACIGQLVWGVLEYFKNKKIARNNAKWYARSTAAFEAEMAVKNANAYKPTFFEKYWIFVANMGGDTKKTLKSFRNVRGSIKWLMLTVLIIYLVWYRIIYVRYGVNLSSQNNRYLIVNYLSTIFLTMLCFIRELKPYEQKT